jgi:flagellar biosynthesis/type III secretory pathway M-ring protein FliF/YscJ
VKRLIQKRKIITQEESLKPQEDAAKKGEVKKSDQLKREGAASQLQGEGDNRNESPKVDETGAKTSGSNSVLGSKEEITTTEKNRKIIRNKNLYLETRCQRMGGS